MRQEGKPSPTLSSDYDPGLLFRPKLVINGWKLIKVFLTFRCRSRRLRRQFDAEHNGQTPEQRMLLETVFDEAVTAFQSVLEPQRPPPRTPSRRPEVAEKATQIRQPPNSPDSVANPTVTFTFDHINDSDGFESDVPPPPPNPAPKVTVASAEVTAEAAATVTPGGLQRLRRGRRSLRKRPRKPSFKAHRVPPKFSCCEDADDEASSSGDDHDQVDSAASIDLVKLQRISIDDDEDSSSSSSSCSEEIFADSSGLQLRLKVLSEAQRTVEEAASVVTDWAKVGAELRSIADKFGDEAEGHHHPGHVDEVDGEGRRVVARHEVDVVSLVNLMLPFSVPQSLWSALVSYAAWKIFKRFQ